MFPSSRKALWAHSAAGAPVDLQFPKVCISVSEQVLFLAYGQSRSGKIEKCYLVGDVSVEADCSEVVILLNSLSSAEANSMDFPGTVNVPTKVGIFIILFFVYCFFCNAGSSSQKHAN